MRFIVFLRVYLFLLILIVLLFIRIYNGISPFSIFTGAVFVFAVTMVSLLTDKRYVQKLVIDKNILHITYTNHFLQQKSIEFETSKITEIKLSKRRILAPLWPPHLDIKYDDEWKNFFILSRELYFEVQERIGLKFTSITNSEGSGTTAKKLEV